MLVWFFYAAFNIFLILHPTVHFVTDKFSLQLHLSCCLDQRFQKQCLTHSFHSFHSLVSKPCRRCHMNSSQAQTSLVGRGCFRLFSACHCCDIRPLCVYYTSARMQVNVILILKLKIMQMGLIFRLPTVYFMRLQLAKKAIRTWWFEETSYNFPIWLKLVICMLYASILNTYLVFWYFISTHI